jgi:hypothetical protein
MTATADYVYSASEEARHSDKPSGAAAKPAQGEEACNRYGQVPAKPKPATILTLEGYDVILHGARVSWPTPGLQRLYHPWPVGANPRVR